MDLPESLTHTAYGLKDQGRSSEQENFLTCSNSFLLPNTDTAVSSKKLDIFHSYLSKKKKNCGKKNYSGGF